MSGNTILTKNEKKIPKAPKAKAKVISFQNFTNSIRFLFPTQKHDTLHFLLTSLDLFVYICLLKFARTQTDSGSRLPVEKYLSPEVDSMDESTLESLKIGSPAQAKLSDEKTSEEISNACEESTQVLPVVSQVVKPENGKGLKNEKDPSNQLDNKSKEADVAIAELTASEDDSLPKSPSSKILPVALDDKKSDITASIDDSNQPSQRKKDKRLTMEEKIENSKKAKKPLIEQEPPFAGMKLKKSKVVQREWKEPELETVQLKDHACEKLPQIEMVNSNCNNNFLISKKSFLLLNPPCNGSICKHSRKSLRQAHSFPKRKRKFLYLKGQSEIKAPF